MYIVHAHCTCICTSHLFPWGKVTKVTSDNTAKSLINVFFLGKHNKKLHFSNLNSFHTCTCTINCSIKGPAGHLQEKL